MLNITIYIYVRGFIFCYTSEGIRITRVCNIISAAGAQQLRNGEKSGEILSFDFGDRKKKREEVKLRKKENLVEKTPRRARRHAVPLAMTKRKKKEEY